MNLTAAIIGLGQIGQGYDYNCCDDAYILTHASAFKYHPDFELLGGIDLDIEKRDSFIRKYERQAFQTIQDFSLYYKPDIVSIAVPTIKHYIVFQQVIEYLSPRAIICEKPISMSSIEAKDIIKTVEGKGIILLVNYMRRFEPGVLVMKDALKKNIIGHPYKVIAKYSKGLLNNGSHFIDLFLFLFGEVLEIKIISAGRLGLNNDPEPDVLLKFSNGTDVYLLAGREENYSIFEMEILGTQGNLRYLNGGEKIFVNPVVKDPVYPGYHRLSHEGVHIKSDMNRYQWHVVDHLWRNIMRQQALNSTGKTALKTLEISEQIIKAREHILCKY